MSKLNNKQQIFCHEYLKDFNATQAAIRAGYSEKSAYSQAHDLLKKPEIRNYISQVSKQNFQAIGLSTQRIIAEVSAIAFGSDSTNNERLKALDILLKSSSVTNESTKIDFPSKVLKLLQESDYGRHPNR